MNKKAILYAVLLTYISFFLSGVIIIEEENKTLAEVLFLYPNVLRHLSTGDMLSAQYKDWFFILLPLTTGISCIPFFCSELNTEYYKLLLIRDGKKKFIRDILSAQFVCSVLSFLFATLLFKITILIIGKIMPYDASFGMDNGIQVFQFLSGDFVSLLYCLFISGLSILFASLFADVYITLTFVFLINYLVYEHINYLIYEHLQSVFIIIFAAVFSYILTAYIIKRRWLEC